MLRNTPNNETIIVEYGFADSTGDDVSQLKNNWEELTEAVVRALADYVGVTYIPPEGSEVTYYVVKSGDTLYGIAREYGVTVDAIKSANNLTSNALSIGMRLIIPSVISPSNNNYYIVKSGDTLYGIAREYGVTVDAIKSANNLTSNTLTIGMKLVIPSSTTTTDTSIYVVNPGDTLYKIANMYGMSVDELKALNGLTSNVLNIGQQLLVSGSEMPEANTYIVKSGDSLYSIAKKYGISVDALKSANNKTSNLLSIGEILNIPTTNETYKTYVVKSGDTLYGIARTYNTTVNAIKSLNNLNNNILSVGMVLKLPI